MTFHPLRSRAPLLVVVFTLFGAFAFGQDKDWRPVDAADLHSSVPVVDPGADAEAIFWEVRVDDSDASSLSLRHYVRVKVYTEKGRDQFSKHDILFTRGSKVKEVDARVTKPDGTVVQLKKDDVVERDILRANGVKVKAKTFALPGLETGSIVEYRYREVIENAEATMRLIFQREVPIRTESYYVKPFSGTRGMYYESFNVGNTRFEKDKDGFHRATMTNVPAFREEPMMPPTDDVRSWMYIYYAATVPKNADEYWKNVSEFHYGHTKDTFKVGDEIKATTAELIKGAATDEEKVRRIYDWTKTQLRNLSYAVKLNEEELKKALQNKTPNDTVKAKFGAGFQIDAVFGAMARAAGFEVREALSGSRNEMIFDPRIPNVGVMVNSTSVAVKIGDKWQFFSPASYYAPFGMMSWAEEGQTALIAEEKGPVWRPIPLAAAEKSMERRSGKFKILDDGTLEGEGRIEYTGHQAAFQKSVNRDDSASEREERFRNGLKTKILGSAEVTDVQMQNLDDPEKPVVYTFKVKVPGFASRTGKRLFFQPNVFERSAKPTFTASTRKYDVYISYPYSENDELTIDVPAGFALENPDAPVPVKDQQGIGSDIVKISTTADGKTLIYRRDFSFGNNGFIRFPAASYSAVKALFEAFNKAEVHQLTLREAAK